MTIATKLRETIQKLRRTPMPLKDIIPMLIAAVDEIELLTASLARRKEQYAALEDKAKLCAAERDAARSILEETRLSLAKLATLANQEPVAQVHAAHLRPAEQGNRWCREVLLYSGQHDGDLLNGQNPRVKLYAAAGAAPVPEGWQLVPVEPTSLMIAATFVGFIEDQDVMAQQKRRERVRDQYKQMLAAAPKDAP